MADKHFGGDLAGRLLLSGGLGGMGGAQPLAATLNGAVFLGIEVDPERIERRVRTGYCDRIALNLDEALDICEDAREQKRAVSVGLVGNCAELLPEIVKRGVKIDAVTDQTSAHDPLNGYIPAGLSLSEAAELRRADPHGEPRHPDREAGAGGLHDGRQHRGGHDQQAPVRIAQARLVAGALCLRGPVLCPCRR